MSGSHRAPEPNLPAGRLLRWIDRRAARIAARDDEDRAAGRAERVPPPRRATRGPTRGATRGARSRGPAWYRTGRGQLLIAVAAVAAAVLLRVLVPSGPEDPGPPLGSGLPHFGADWSGADGTRYRISVTPLSTLSSRASSDGCVRAPAAGFVNARFGVRIENLSGRTAPVPAVDFGANLDASGSADPTAVDLPASRTNVSVTPGARGAGCGTASSIGPRGRSGLEKGAVLDLVGTVGGISIPVQPGLSVIVRYTDQDGEQELLAPFPAFPVGS